MQVTSNQSLAYIISYYAVHIKRLSSISDVISSKLLYIKIQEADTYLEIKCKKQCATYKQHSNSTSEIPKAVQTNIPQVGSNAGAALLSSYFDSRPAYHLD